MIFTMNPDENYLKPGASEIGFSGVRVDELYIVTMIFDTIINKLVQKVI